ncbi:MAG: AEC family transporter [Pseudomonadota bacterium]
MNHAVLSSLAPVVLCIFIGFLVARRGWIRASAVKDLSNLAFLVLAPALLFRTMGSVRVQQLDFQPVGSYFLAAAIVFAGVLVACGFDKRATLLAMAGTFSNVLMVGVPLVDLLYGDAGLVTLFTLISVHSLILVTIATFLLELASAREDAAAGRHADRHLVLTVLAAVRNGILHPVPLPIILGLLFAQTGLVLPEALDKSLLLLGSAQVPVSLVLVGVTLAFTTVGTHLRGALGLCLVKNLAHPLAMLAVGKLLGLSGLPLTVMVLTAALPIGANVFLFSQRYRTAEGLVTAGVAVSTALGLVTLPLILVLAAHL